ncbi:MAG: uracil-DNA glycosylase [Fusobacteria bacterium]|nr:uracil-DNA glycosylase [Fusobacteriota bacterium]
MRGNEDIWEELEHQVSSCKRCKLCYTRKNSVLGEGSFNTTLMFVGEGPGEDEDNLGRPFVGKAGQLFDKILQSVELDRAEIFLTNIVKCRPPRNRIPEEAEIENCAEFLNAQIALINPKIIVAVGNVASNYFLSEHTKLTISKIRGESFYLESGIIVIPIFHPSYLLRNSALEEGSPKYLTWKDMLKIRELYNDMKEKI